MKANELRIGNLVWEDYGGIYKVIMVSPNDVYLVKPLQTVSGKYGIDSVKPIPLTEQWLLKFGFEKRDKRNTTHHQWSKGEVNRLNDVNGDFYYLLYNHSIKINFVHQLQNLYFALTGNELEMEGGQDGN